MTTNYHSKRWTKDPSANLFYKFDFAQNTNKTGFDEDYLEANVTLIQDENYPVITSTPTGLNISDVEVISSNTVVRCFITGGQADVDYNVTCRIKTSQNEVDEFTKVLIVRET